MLGRGIDFVGQVVGDNLIDLGGNRSPKMENFLIYSSIIIYINVKQCKFLYNYFVF